MAPPLWVDEAGAEDAELALLPPLEPVGEAAAVDTPVSDAVATGQL